jgi:predicted enzyme related to lactoylglutathione lyase
MSFQDRAGAVVYAKDIARVSVFYAGVAGLRIAHSEDDHIVLESKGLQLVVVAIPERIASSIQIETPPVRREDTPIKLVFPVPSISAARVAAPKCGGELNDEDREWTFQGTRVCEGHDPEGNVVQFRQSAP